MAGAAKKRAQAEKKALKSSGDSTSPSHSQTQGSSSKSIPRLDGNRDPTPPRGSRVAADYTKATDLKNVSDVLGAGGWYAARGLSVPSTIPTRPKFNTHGKETGITLNTFNVIRTPKQIVHQYDVAWGGETDFTKRVLLKKIWHSKAVKKALGEPNNLWIYDGNKLAWSAKRLDRDELRIPVDLDAEEGRQLMKKPNKHTVFIRHARKIDFTHLQSFLDGQAEWSADCIDTINFVDHLLREHPSQKYTQIRKSFFARGEQRNDLTGGVEAFKGVFASLRPVLDNQFKKGLAINVDVANGSFWRAQPLTRAVCQMFGCETSQIIQRLRDARKDWKNSFFKRDLRRLKRVGVTTTHLDPQHQTSWIIDEIANIDATEAKFKDSDDHETTVADYFKKKYKISVVKGLPVVKMTKKIRGGPVYFPMDVLQIEQNQRYNAKLSEQQTSAMIRFAVTVPKDRWAAIQHGLRMLDWDNDPYLRHYGLQINSAPAKVKARLLPHPTVHFGVGSKEATISPRDTLAGRWRLDGRKFAINNRDRPIRAWGVCVIQGRGSPQPAIVQNFIKSFISIYEGHGGQFASHPEFGKTPWFGPGNLGDGGELVAKVWQATGNRYKATPMLLLFVVNDRNVEVYRRIKKSCDLRFGVVSQVMQSRHVSSAAPQYISNVCMKVNAKLGGATCVAKSNVIPKVAPKANTIPTMVVGADVSHPAPGAGSGEAASFAAMTVSADQHFVKYWADVQTNGNRIEMITSENIHNHFGPMVNMWMKYLGRGQPPKRVLYIRDGVAENQYAAVLEEEVRDMKETFSKLGCREIPKFTVVIAAKRHHIRFFPDAGKGDRNNNPLPGTLVESGCTHPFEFDFYLCSHVAIKGTARPIHYQCILNDGEWHADELQSFIFEHSYQYVRSTTPVSLHPAVYYAHLAADRSRAHTNASPVSSGKKESAAEKKSTTGSSHVVEIPPLVALNNSRGIKEVMWYI